MNWQRNLIITPLKTHVIMSSPSKLPCTVPVIHPTKEKWPCSDFYHCRFVLLIFELQEVALYRMYFCVCLNYFVILVHTFINIKQYLYCCIKGWGSLFKYIWKRLGETKLSIYYVKYTVIFQMTPYVSHTYEKVRQVWPPPETGDPWNTTCEVPFWNYIPSVNIPLILSLHSDLSSFGNGYELPLQGFSKGITQDISRAKLESPDS